VSAVAPGLPALSDHMTGSFAVRTGSGTLYAFNLDEPRAIVRLAKDQPPSPRYANTLPGALRRDGEAIKLLKIVEIRLGRPGLMWLDVRLDGVPTFRMTTNVVSINALQNERR